MTKLTTPIRIGRLALRNRLYRAPVLEGAGGRKNPSSIYARHFVPNAQSGVGLIIQGNTIVTAEGRTSPGMTAVASREDMAQMQPMTDAVHQVGGRIVTQLGHGGAYALESWHKESMAARTSPPLAASKLPWWIRPFHTGVKVMTTAEVEALIARFGQVALWAKEAGYDGVQLAGGNAKLIHQFLSPTYTRRKDRFGGDLERRCQLIVEIRDAIAKRAGADFPVLLKYSAYERAPFGRGITIEDGVQIAKIAESAGFDAVTPAGTDALPNTALCRGTYPAASFGNERIRAKLIEATGNKRYFWTIRTGFWLAARRYPLTPVWNRAVFSAVKAAVKIPVFAVGGIRTPKEANEILASGDADLIGVGRPFYTEPKLAEWFLSETGERSPRCQSCNQCVVPQMLGMAGVCYNPEVNRKKLTAEA